MKGPRMSTLARNAQVRDDLNTADKIVRAVRDNFIATEPTYVLRDLIVIELEKARAEAREACARIAESRYDASNIMQTAVCSFIADDIRARFNSNTEAHEMPQHRTSDDVNDLHGSDDAPKWARAPWHVVEYGDGDQLVVCSDVAGNWRICFMATHGGSRSSWEKIQAEANLISAAPDLYEALSGLMLAVGKPEDGGSDMDAWNAAKAALAKARGEKAQ